MMDWFLEYVGKVCNVQPTSLMILPPGTHCPRWLATYRGFSGEGDCPKAAVEDLLSCFKKVVEENLNKSHS